MKKLFTILKFIWKHPLASKSRVLAFGRFFSFQFAQRLNPYPILYPLVENSSLLVKKGMAGATGNIYTGLLEFNEMAFVLHVLREEDIFMDVGANIGVYTVLAAKNAGAKVLSVEPVPSTFIHLTNNVLLNDIKHLVTLFPVGIGKEAGILTFTNTMDTVNHVLTVNEQDDINNAIKIQVRTIDELAAGNEPVIMKMDIEGFEWPALNGAKKLLAGDTLKSLIVELNGSGGRYGFTDDDIHELLLSFQFLPFEYDPFLRTLMPLKKYGPFNTIYLKDKDWVAERVTKAKKFKILDRMV